MSTSRPGFSDGERHGWIDKMCSAITRQVHGKAAEALLAGDQIPENAAVVALPVWRWAVPGVDIGRKGNAFGGGRLMMPIRIRWSAGSLLLVEPDQRRRPKWLSAGLGVNASGATWLQAVPGVVQPDLDGELPSSVTAPVLSSREIKRELQRLVADGIAGRWDALLLMQPRVREAVVRANTVISRDVGGADGADLLDGHQLDALQQEILLGSEGDRSSPAARLLQRCVDDVQVFAKVDPLKWIVTALRRDAQQQVQVLVGDPRPGRKIRAMQVETGITDPNQLVDAYRQRFPSDQVAIRRVQRALTVHARSLEARGHGACLGDTVIPDFADEVVERLSAPPRHATPSVATAGRRRRRSA